MSYVIKAVLSNPCNPEYGQITIPFPVPDEGYDQLIEDLEAMQIGDPLKQDCQVGGLDSVDDGEAEQFLAMAHMRDVR